MHWVVRVAVATVASVATASADSMLRVGPIERGIEEPGRYAAANLFDGKPNTAYCGPAGSDGEVLVTLSSADAKLLAAVTTIDIDTAGTKRVDVLTFYNGALERDRMVTGRDGAIHLAFPPPKPDVSLSIELRFEPADRTHPACASKLELVDANGPIRLPDLQAMVDRHRARDARLAALSDPVARASSYVSSYTWQYRNPMKETSTWESEAYLFAPDGTYKATGRSALVDDKPIITSGTWTIADRGATLVIGSWRLALQPCAATPGHLCGVAPHSRYHDTLVPTDTP